MKKMNSKGFTLIELLAVIVIMGILMMVAIPAMTRYIENSRKDTFLNTGKEYVNAVRNMWVSDNFTCGGVVSTANPAGTYYVEINSTDNTNNLLESGGKSSWGNRDVNGYVRVVLSESAGGDATTEYYLQLTDGAGHGIVDDGSTTTPADKLVRGNILTKDAEEKEIPEGAVTCIEA